MLEDIASSGGSDSQSPRPTDVSIVESAHMDNPDTSLPAKKTISRSY